MIFPGSLRRDPVTLTFDLDILIAVGSSVGGVVVLVCICCLCRLLSRSRKPARLILPEGTLGPLDRFKGKRSLDDCYDEVQGSVDDCDGDLRCSVHLDKISSSFVSATLVEPMTSQPHSNICFPAGSTGACLEHVYNLSPNIKILRSISPYTPLSFTTVSHIQCSPTCTCARQKKLKIIKGRMCGVGITFNEVSLFLSSICAGRVCCRSLLHSLAHFPFLFPCNLEPNLRTNLPLLLKFRPPCHL
jgi:hypothetical protein